MKVLHINTYASGGGAAIAARRHCEAMRKAGIDAKLLALYGQPDEMTVISAHQAEALKIKQKWGLIRHKLNRLVVRRTAWHWLDNDYDICDIPLVRDADIIYIHWVNEFIGINGLQSLLETKKTVVWYMHDMWPMTGGCHYSFSCNRYITDCRRCPQMKFLRNLTSHVLGKKLNNWKGYTNLIPVAPSRWLTNCIKNSALFSNLDTYTVPNVIDTDYFIQRSQKDVRVKFGLPVDKKLIMANAIGYDNPFKGVQYLLKAMEGLANEDYEFVVVGKCNLEQFTSIAHEKVHLLGFIGNQSDMVDIYNCADLLMITSLAENFPNVVIEAMACGVPVVGFATGGIIDQIHHKENGWIVAPKDVNGLIEGVKWSLETADYSMLQNNARKYVEECCSYRRVLEIHKPLLQNVK